MEVYGTKESALSGFWVQRQFLLVDQFIVGLGLPVRFVDNKENIEYHQPYQLIEYKWITL